MTKKYKYKVFISSLVAFIISTFICSLMIINSDKYLNSFSIINVSNVSTLFSISYENVKAATNYEVIIYDENNEVIHNNKYQETSININLEKIKYDKKYKIVVIAYNDLGDSVSVKKPYTFTYTEPTFNNLNNLVLEKENDYTLYIDGEADTKEYFIGLYYEDKLINKEKLISNEYIINKKYFESINGVLTVKLFDGDNIINTLDLYSGVSPISDIKIESPINDGILDYNDVSFNFSGGDNADEYILEIYKDSKLIKSVSLDSNRAIVSSEFFEKDKSYQFKIIANYLDYTDYSKTDVVSFKMNEKETLLPAYLNTNPNYVKENSLIVINNPNNDGVIYYTLDGTIPTEDSKIYNEPIVADKNMIINAVIKEKNKNDSMLSTFNINIDNKKEYRVYLSPSNQTGNIGVKEVNFTNESKEMNDLTNYIEKRLKDYGVKVFRNNPSGNINLWVADSKYYNSDLHLAIHSNGSTDHLSKGIETWINEQNSNTYSLASIIQKDLINIYYDKENGNRGVKYSNGSLGETRMPNFGILVEIAHHDYYDDAKWIMENKELIGNTIANSILKYFGILE